MSKGRGFRTAGEATLVRDACRRGWEVTGRSGTNHLKMRWPASGVVVTVPSVLDDGYVRRTDRRLRKIEAGEKDSQ